MKNITITIDGKEEEIIRIAAYALNMRESEVVELMVSKMLENAKNKEQT